MGRGNLYYGSEIWNGKAELEGACMYWQPISIHYAFESAYYIHGYK